MQRIGTMCWETEVPTGEEIRFFPLFFSEKVARRLHEGESSILRSQMLNILSVRTQR